MAFESAASYFFLKLFVASSGGELCRRGSSDDPVVESSSELPIIIELGRFVSSSRRRTTSGESCARDGRYAFIATTEAPKPILARTASRAESGQNGELDGSGRKRAAAAAPTRAKMSRRRFRWCADDIASRAISAREKFTYGGPL